jgi:hypothetical protein
VRSIDWHPGEDDLIFQLHGDGSGEERERVVRHLAECAACRQAWDELQSTLKIVDEAGVPEPDAGFEARIWNRVQPALEPAYGRGSWRPIVPLAAWAATVAAMVVAGYTWRDRLPQPPPADTEVAARPGPGEGVRERVLLTALDQHFASTEMLLVELLNAPAPAEGGFDFERAVADDLVASGRLYRETARQTGRTELAAMLEDLEGVLVEVARTAETPAPEDVDVWRERIETNGLLFKVRAVTNDIRDRRDNPGPTSKGAL